MPTLKLNEDGQLVNEDGEVFEIEGEAVTVEGAKTQADIDKTVNERLARERKKLEELETAAKQVPNLQKMVDESKATIEKLEGEAQRIKEEASAESQAQITKLRQEADKYKTERDQIAAQALQFEVKTMVLGAAKDQFNDPATDLVPHFLSVHKREPVRGDDGKPTGEFKDFFKLPVKGENGEVSHELMPLEKAVEAWAEAHPHHIRATGASGSGGGGTKYVPGTSNVKRSEMNSAQKAEFITKHGGDAYRALPE